MDRPELYTWPSIDAALSDAEIVGMVARWQCARALAGFPSSLAERATASDPQPAVARRAAFSTDEPSLANAEPSLDAQPSPTPPLSSSPSPSPAADASPSLRPSSAPTALVSQPSKRRVSFCMNAGPQRGVVQSAALVPCCAVALLRVAANKLRLKRKEAERARCFVWHTGDEVRRDAPDDRVACLIRDGAVLAISLGEDYSGTPRKTPEVAAPATAAGAAAAGPAAGAAAAAAPAAAAGAAAAAAAAWSDDAPADRDRGQGASATSDQPVVGLGGIARLLASLAHPSVIVMVGAGMSVSAGIPDFRTPGTGLYDNLQEYDLPYAEAIFDIRYFHRNPAPFYRLCRDMWPGSYDPTPAHYFVRLLHDKGVLFRCYTQNIDSLETAAGLPSELLVAAHGNFDTASVCVPPARRRDSGFGSDRAPTVEVAELRGALQAEGEEGWRALAARHGGLVKPDIVFFGEELPPRFEALSRRDFPQCELLIVLGTSLAVQPFASLVGKVGPCTPRLLINRERVGERGTAGGRGLGRPFDFERAQPHSNDVLYLGDCDAAVRELAAALGWQADLERLCAGDADGLRACTTGGAC